MNDLNTPKIVGEDMTLSKVLNWLLNQSLPIIILIVLATWQTQRTQDLEKKIELCNSERIKMYDTQITLIIKALDHNETVLLNNSKALENNSLILQSVTRRR